MFVDLDYNPQAKVWNYPGVEKSIETLREAYGDEIAEYHKNLIWDNVLEKLSTGVYEYFDCNDPNFNGIDFRTHEHVSVELATELHFEFLDWCLERGDKEIYMSHPYGVCDNWKQIFEKIPEIKYYKESNEKFVIFLCRHVRDNEPEWGGWRWHKWGPYIGEKEPQYEYLHDEPEIEMIYTFHVSRIVETPKKY